MSGYRVVDVKPWLPHRKRIGAPVLIVLHATAGATARSSIEHLRGIGLSYNYIMARDSKDSARTAKADQSDPIVYKCAPGQTGHCFHVGSAVPGPTGKGINSCSIGVSLANMQNGEPYTPQQKEALIGLLKEIKAAVPTLKWLTTHAVVQPWNRADPRNINGKEVAEEIGLEWWEPTPEAIKAHRPKKPKV